MAVALALAGAVVAQQFEVASIKPVDPNSSNTSPMAIKAQEMIRNTLPIGLVPGDRARVTIRNYSLANLIATAYRVRTSRISGPEWLSEQRFDVDANIPSDAPFDQVNEMLPALLEQRFALKLHRETKLQQGYALVVGKNGPKLQVSVLAAHPPNSANVDGTGMQTAPEMKMPPMPKIPSGVPLTGRRWSSFRGMTAARLAEQLSSYVDAPVMDMTGLDGKYDVSLETAPPSIDRDSGVEEPGITIFECVEQLGLKLEPRKVAVQTIVVDSASKMPTAN